MSQLDSKQHLLGDYVGEFVRVTYLDYRTIEQPLGDPKQWTPEQIRDDDNLLGINLRWESLWSLWRSAERPNRAPSEYFVKWALSKGIQISWLGTARAHGYFSSESNSSDRSAEQPPLVSEPSDRRALLRIIGALTELMLAKTPAGKPGLYVFAEQKDIVELIDAQYKGIRGLGDSNLQKKFAEANAELGQAKRATP